MQKREASWQEQQQENQTAMNNKIFQLQTDLQDQKNKNIPAPLQFGPSQNAQVEEALNTMEGEHQKAVADLKDRLLQAKVSADKEHRNEKNKLQDELEGMKLQCQNLNDLSAQKDEEDKINKEAKKKARPKARATSQPPASTQMIDISDEPLQEADEQEAEDEEEGEDEAWDDIQGWEWDPNKDKYVKTNIGKFPQLDHEERFQYLGKTTLRKYTLKTGRNQEEPFCILSM